MKIRRSLFIFVFFTQVVLGSGILSHDEFTKLYVDRVKQTYPEVRCTVEGDLEVTIESEDRGKSTSYLDNAYSEYKADPEFLDDVLVRHVNVLRAFIREDGFKKNPSDLVPVIKDNGYLENVQEVLKKTQDDGAGIYFERLNSDLVVLYAFDSPDSLSFASKKDLMEAGVNTSDLRKLAISNLNTRLPSITREGDDSLSMIVAGGMFEASLLLFEKIWSKDNFKVKGDIVVFVPSRDVVLVTGSEDSDGLSRASAIIKESDWPYMISPNPFVRKNGQWERFNPPL